MLQQELPSEQLPVCSPRVRPQFRFRDEQTTAGQLLVLVVGTIEVFHVILSTPWPDQAGELDQTVVNGRVNG
jgi:hypothetical protein